MNRPWRDCAARNIRISASAKYFRKNGGQGVCLFQIAKFQRAGKAAPQIRFPYGATGPPALSGCTVRHRQATSGGPVLQAVGHFCAQKRAARICMRRRRRHPPCAYGCTKRGHPPTPNALTRREYSPGRVSVSAQMTPLHPSPIAANAPASRRAQCAARAHPLPAHRMMLALGHTFSWVCLQAFPLPLERALPCSACKRSEPVRACVWIAYPYPCKQRPVLLLNRRGCAGFAARTTCCRGLSPSCVRRIACVKIAFS